MSWDRRWMDMARLVASWSKDRSTKVGAVIVDHRQTLLSVGWNGFPRGIDDDVPNRHDRPAKYLWTEHAERNAIYNAAANGIRLSGSTIYVPWYPCSDCARAIIQADIRSVCAIKPNWDDERWGRDFQMVRGMLKEAGIMVRWFEE